MYDHMKNRYPVEFSLDDFQKRYLTDKKFNRLMNEWKKSNYNKQLKPSLDRIDCKKSYTTNNTQMLTWAENRYKQTLDGKQGRKGSVLQMLGHKVVARFKSQREAVVKTGIPQGNMSAVLNGRRETAAGYKFIYENPNLIKS